MNRASGVRYPTENGVRRTRLQPLIALLLVGAIFGLPLRSLSTLRQPAGSKSPAELLSVRSAKRVRTVGLSTPRLLVCQLMIGTGREDARGQSFHWRLKEPNPHYHQQAPLPLAGGLAAHFPMRC